MNNIRTLLNVPLIIQFIVFVALIAITLLWVDQNVHAISLDIFFAINLLFTESLKNYVSCRYGGDITICLSNIACIAYDSNWYRLSSNEQRFVGLIMKRAQIELTLTGFGVVTCSMGTFLAVRAIPINFK